MEALAKGSEARRALANPEYESPEDRSSAHPVLRPGRWGHEMTKEELDKVSWKFVRAAVIVEIRSIWVQPHQLGLTVDATEVLVHKEDDACGFGDSDSE